MEKSDGFQREVTWPPVWGYALAVTAALCLLLSGCSNPVGATVEPGEKTQNLGAEPYTRDYVLVIDQQTVTPTASLSPEPGNDFLDQLAEDTWHYLSSDWATDNHLPWSWRSAVIEEGDYANTAEIGLYALSYLAAYDFQRPWSPTWEETEAEVEAVLDQLRAWQTGSQTFQPHGPNAYNNSVFYQWYWINWKQPVVGNGAKDRLVPSIDNAWLAVSLITIREYSDLNEHPDLAQKADEILADMNFRLWYDAESALFYWGEVEDPLGGKPADYYSNENRLINFVVRALGQLEADEFQRSLAVLQGPSGEYTGILVEKVSWDGSYFTYGAPALFIREMETAYGRSTITPATEAQIVYAADQEYAAWGLSDCYSVGNVGYVQQGTYPVAMPDSPETEPGLVTAHASGLALITPFSAQAIANLKNLSSSFPCAYNSDYGFHDSVMTDKKSDDYGLCSDRFSALAQEWLFLALVNYQNNFIWRYFYHDEGVHQAHLEMYGYYESYLPFLQP